MQTIGVALICVKVALIPVVFDLSADVAFTLPKALFSHATAYLLAGVMVSLFISSRPLFNNWSPVHVPVAAYLLVNIVATLFAQSTSLALYGAHERMLGLGTTLDGVVLYLGVAYLIRTRRQAMAVALSFLAGATAVLAYEFIQVIGRDPIHWAFDTAARPSSMIGQANSLAEYLVVVAALAAATAILADPLNSWQRGALSGLAVVALLGAVATQTRSVLLGLAGAESALVLVTWLRSPRVKDRLIISAGAVGVVVAFGVVLIASPLGNRVATTVESEPLDVSGTSTESSQVLEGAAEVRVALYRIALAMVVDRPIVGYGPDNFLAALPQYRSGTEPFEVQANPNSSAHSWVAQVASSTGALGLVAFVSITLVASWLALKHVVLVGAGVGLAMIGAFVGEGLTTINAVSTDWLFWAGAGLVAAATPRPFKLSGVRTVDAGVRRGSRALARPRHVSPAQAFLAIGVALFGVVLAASEFGPLDASRAAKASLVARLAGRDQQALERGVRATSLDDGRAQYWDTLGLAYVSAGRVKDAVVAFDRASQLAPYDVRYDGDLARALALVGQQGDNAARQRSVEVADRAYRLDPNNPIASLTRAIVLQVNGDLPEAARSIERAVSLDRVSPSGQTPIRQIYVTGIQVFSAAHRPDDAYALAHLGLSRLPVPSTQVPVRIELARALAANDRFADALTEIDKALAIDPASTAAQQLRAQIGTHIP